MVAVMLLDGQVMPEQYEQERIDLDDIQSLLKKVHVTPLQEFSNRFPDEMCSRLTVHLKDGTEYSIEKTDYEGFTTRPMSGETITAKFNMLARPYTKREKRE